MSWLAIVDHLPALPEVLLLFGTCVLMIADVYSKHPRRRIAYWLAQGTLLSCFLATALILYGTGTRVANSSCTKSTTSQRPFVAASVAPHQLSCLAVSTAWSTRASTSSTAVLLRGFHHPLCSSLLG